MNSGLITVMLIDCMAVIPCSAGMRPSACMTKVEKAKKIPATSALPIAPVKVRRKIA
jgi:hypothetical protein